MFLTQFYSIDHYSISNIEAPKFLSASDLLKVLKDKVHDQDLMIEGKCFTMPDEDEIDEILDEGERCKYGWGVACYFPIYSCNLLVEIAQKYKQSVSLDKEIDNIVENFDAITLGRLLTLVDA